MKPSFNFTKYLFAFFTLSILFAAFSIFALKKGSQADPQLIAKIEEKYKIFINSNDMNITISDDPSEKTTKTWKISESPKAITIKSLNGDYQVKSSAANNITISASGNISSASAISADSLLKIESSADSLILLEPSDDLVGDLRVTIEIPANYAGDIEFYSATGILSVENIKAKSLTLKTVSGDATISGSTISSLVTDTTSGEIQSFNTAISSVEIKSISGDIQLDNKNPIKGSVSTVSGNLELKLTNQPPTHFNITTVSGDINNSFTNVNTANIKIDINTVSGDIDIK